MTGEVSPTQDVVEPQAPGQIDDAAELSQSVAQPPTPAEPATDVGSPAPAANVAEADQTPPTTKEATPEVPVETITEYDFPATPSTVAEKAFVTATPLGSGDSLRWQYKITVPVDTPEGAPWQPPITIMLDTEALEGVPIDDFMTTLAARKAQGDIPLTSLLNEVKQGIDRRRSQFVREAVDVLTVNLRVQMGALARAIFDGSAVDSGRAVSEILTPDEIALMRAIHSIDSTDPSLATFGFDDNLTLAKDTIASRLFAGEWEKWGQDPSSDGALLPDALLQSLHRKLKQILLDNERVRKAREGN